MIKKWFSYSDEKVLGRALTKEEAREVTGIVRRLAAIVVLRDALDANYNAVRDSAFDWRKRIAQMSAPSTAFGGPPPPLRGGGTIA